MEPVTPIACEFCTADFVPLFPCFLDPGFQVCPSCLRDRRVKQILLVRCDEQDRQQADQRAGTEGRIAAAYQAEVATLFGCEAPAP